MIVSAWYDGHGTYGLRIMGGQEGLWFRPEWETTTVHLPDGGEPVVMAITESFWSGNPVLRSQRIRDFLNRNGFIPWDKQFPPHFELEPIGGGEFRLKWIERPEGQLRLGL